MENAISISMLNDFIFCPASIYFHLLYDGVENILFQSEFQLNGTKAHKLRAKYLTKFGYRLQYSVFKIKNSQRILSNIINETKNVFEKEFEQTDSVYIFKMSENCKITTFGYACNEETDFL